MKVDYKGDILEAISLPKVLRPWIITSTHEFCGHQGRDRCYNKIRATYYWSGMKNDICQAISNCKICKMESPNLGKYMNLSSRNWHSANAFPRNGYNRNKIC